jgi:Mor family transcriptional regulator
MTLRELPPSRLMRDAPELLRDLFDQAAHLGRKRGLSAEDADALALELVDTMAANWGGRHINFPKGTSIKLIQRDLAIYQEFNGRNHSELAAKYGVTTVWVYAVIRKVRELTRKEGQPGLFEGCQG